MKKNMTRFSAVFTAVFGLMFSTVFADLGLQQVATDQGVSAVGQAVLTAAQAVYENNTDPAVIQQQLIAMINEAVATGNEEAVRYALVAVLMAGGVDNIAQGTTAINNSNAFSQYPVLTAETVSSAQSLMGGGTTGGGDQQGGGTTGGGDQQGGGTTGGDKQGGGTTGGDKQGGGYGPSDDDNGDDRFSDNKLPPGADPTVPPETDATPT
jgi:hypothetical protein